MGRHSPSVWRERARQRIADLVKDMPEGASLAERRKVLWGKGYPAHQNTRWGRKMWGKEVRAYLARHGDYAWPGEFEFPAHIHFPFRENGDG